jgi:VWFA-related protein
MIRPCRLAAAVLAFAASAAHPACQPAARLAAAVADGERGWGDLPLAGVYALDEAALEDGRLVATVTARLDVAALTAARTPRLGALCAAVVVDAGGGLAVVDERTLELPELAGKEALAGVAAWTYHVRLELPDDAAQIMVLVQEPALGAWGAAVADEGEAPAAPGPSAVTVAGAPPAWYVVERRGEPAAGRKTAAGGALAVVVRLVPPRDQPATGGTRFDALTTSDAVDRVVFELDGKEAETDGRRPFVARLPLASPARPQTVRAVAYDQDGKVLGEDSLVVNELDVPFRVRIAGFEPKGEAIEVSAEVSVPAGAALDRVELYRNEELVERFTAPPWRGRVPAEGGPEDYVRVAAFLADGSSIDDVVLLASPALVERVEVNLVELHVVVTDERRRPVGDLGARDFTVLHRGQPRQIESFAYADDVPLLMGLVIDTSGSMRLVMHDTKRAAGRFIGQTVLAGDRAFVVDFDRQPRLRQGTTDDVAELMLSLAQLEADGATAMYDAIVFSMLQFEKQPGRKALVVLTDGDDHDSRYGPKDCLEYGQSAGVPIYVIGLGGLDGLRRAYSVSDLERVTARTGGRLYFVESLEELQWAYDEINAELRSQYSLTFYADADLSPEERRKVEVRLARPGLEPRTVLGSRRGGS